MEVERLAENLTSESKAYGYTLTIWGGVVDHRTVSHAGRGGDISLRGGRARAFAALAAIAFDELFVDTDAGADQQLVVASMVHVVATLGNLLLTWLIVTIRRGVGISAIFVFPVVGFEGTFTYNVMLLLENRMAQVVTWFGDGDPNAAAE